MADIIDIRMNAVAAARRKATLAAMAVTKRAVSLELDGNHGLLIARGDGVAVFVKLTASDLRALGDMALNLADMVDEG